jgi:hypothetical protein
LNIKQPMATIRRRSKPAEPERYIDLVNPENGEVIPTTEWVATELIKQGWSEKKEGSETQITKGENDGTKDN